MKKEYTLRIYKKLGSTNFDFNSQKEIDSMIKSLSTAFDGFNIANCDLDGGRSEASEDDILEEISGSNNYCCDQTTYFFKVFSKKAK